MDKPRHPLVVRPWKTQQTQRNKWNAAPLRIEKESGQPDWKGVKIFSSPKTTGKRSKKPA
jgi:hypothetical protein